MKGKRFTEQQIIRILQEAEAGLSVSDVCRKHNCSEQSFYRWKSQYGGMEVLEAKRDYGSWSGRMQSSRGSWPIRHLDIRMLRDVNSRKW